METWLLVVIIVSSLIGLILLGLTLFVIVRRIIRRTQKNEIYGVYERRDIEREEKRIRQEELKKAREQKLQQLRQAKADRATMKANAIQNKLNQKSESQKAKDELKQAIKEAGLNEKMEDY